MPKITPKKFDEDLPVAARLSDMMERRNMLEAAAKRAYGIWAYRVSPDVPPWENLPVPEMEAWRDVVESLQTEDTTRMVCVSCRPGGPKR